jgi:hypothetical protein
MGAGKSWSSDTAPPPPGRDQHGSIYKTQIIQSSTPVHRTYKINPKPTSTPVHKINTQTDTKSTRSDDIPHAVNHHHAGREKEEIGKPKPRSASPSPPFRASIENCKRRESTHREKRDHRAEEREKIE